MCVKAKLGFETVYNRNEDFYQARADKSYPEYDVLVTNPPFSGDHIERTFKFCIKSGKPWFLMIPQYCAKKVRERLVAIHGILSWAVFDAHHSLCVSPSGPLFLTLFHCVSLSMCICFMCVYHWVAYFVKVLLFNSGHLPVLSFCRDKMSILT